MEKNTKKETAPDQSSGFNKKLWIPLICIIVILIAGVIYFAHHNFQIKSIVESNLFRDGVYVNDVSIGGLTKDQAKQALAETEQNLLDDVCLVLSSANGRVVLYADDIGLTLNTDDVLESASSLARSGSLPELQNELEDIAVNHRNYEITYVIDEKVLKQKAQQIAQTVNCDPINASFNVENLYTPDKNGLMVEEEALIQLIRDYVEKGDFPVDDSIPAKKVEAELTLEKLQNQLTLRSSASTSFAKSPYNRKSRVFNIKKASSMINGIVVQPGEVFSTNDILGYRTYEAGWQPAPAIVQGRNEDQAGGGVCQVSTTLYHAVLKGDLEVVDRRGHSGRLGYAPGGLDATIDSGRIDFKWKNNTNSPIYIVSWVNDEEKTVHFELYGEPFSDEFDQIELSSKKVRSISPPGPMTYTVDASKPAGYSEVWVKRKSGSEWKSYATYYKDGEEVKTEYVDNTIYKAYAGETIVGPQG